MSDASGMDLRTPIGLLFVLLGLLLVGYGVVTNGDTAMYARSTGVNINLVWGGVMLTFGMLFAGRAKRKQQ